MQRSQTGGPQMIRSQFLSVLAVAAAVAGPAFAQTASTSSFSPSIDLRGRSTLSIDNTTSTGDQSLSNSTSTTTGDQTAASSASALTGEQATSAASEASGGSAASSNTAQAKKKKPS